MVLGRHSFMLAGLRPPRSSAPGSGAGAACWESSAPAVELRERQYPDRQGRLITCEHDSRRI
jgi:hypothetical protein